MAKVDSGQQTTTSRFATSLMDMLERVEYRRVRLDEQFDPVYRLRYQAYRREDGIAINTDGIARDHLDFTPNAMCHGVYIDGVLVSSIRLHFATAEHRHSPCMRMYPGLLTAMLDAGKTYIDPSRFTADREATLAIPALPFLTLRIAAMACEYYNADYCLSGVRDEHAAFYKRVFGSTEIAGYSQYPGMNFPVKLYAADVSDIRNRVADRFPFFMSTPQERNAMFGPDPDAHYLGLIQPTARQAALAEERFVPAQ
ncbi:N-acyl amino acid synthase FeeM domain-containing protein [Pelagibacterium halotolerans]|uniref:N-acyl amino acid synthase FeeM catalytic core domain-containing protein n=1 Tax=Pelagibacterium halotolerans (strain DSM 22347 / JCM 15775 / CGMCC 1.7692 / B2) TaxID=1082931 RepID=G4R6V4_PELHB|nr:hypothetical protein [Pelagibacterium halotolerans]AEQ53227.1 hypothetical protein KKY_3239 [Pelagibacterium halotolerans B2]QJR17141.1 hypothetical protein HKM20_00880 [Pelagibacterium halotolerans]SEA96273.1 hypothetical protein SAMN05428936_11519 [Pelagibacterium halotolerans]